MFKSSFKWPVCVCRPGLQIQLVRGSWSEVLVLGLAQCSNTLSLHTILSAITNHLAQAVETNKITQDRFKEVTINAIDYRSVLLIQLLLLFKFKN